jgi:hypothetical protein
MLAVSMPSPVRIWQISSRRMKKLRRSAYNEKENRVFRCVPIRKREENEIAESLRIQGSFPQASFDLGCQGELTQ